MSAPPATRPLRHPRSLDASLVLLVAIAVDGVIAWLAADVGPTTSIHLAFVVHAAFTIYVGELYKLRRVTWLVLIAAYLMSLAVVFQAYTTPTEPFGAWLAALPVIGPALEPLSGAIPESVTLFGVVTALLGSALLANVMAMQAVAWRTRSLGAWVALVAGGIAIAGIVHLVVSRLAIPADDALSGAGGAMLTPATIVPEWYVLHVYAMLRAVPGKLAGVIIIFLAIALPLLAVWYRAERMRAGRGRWRWRLACLGLAAVWGLLTWQGMQMPDDGVIAVSRALIFCWFAFFLVVPFALRRAKP